MRALAFWLLLGILVAPVHAADDEPPVSMENLAEDDRDVETDPQPGEEIRKYADDGEEGPQRNFGVQAIHDNALFAIFRGDRFEVQRRERGIDVFLWDVQGWVGRDYDKLYLESEGEARLDGGTDVEEANVELLYSRNVASFWDFQAGVRHDFGASPQRSFAAFGFQGLAPYWFEIDATAYVDGDGNVSIGFEAEYELLLTQRLFLIPRFEAGVSFQDVPEYEQWQGVTDVEIGARFTYQIRRELAPYLGVTWRRLLGETAHNVGRQGRDVASAAVVVGLRYWI